MASFEAGSQEWFSFFCSFRIFVSCCFAIVFMVSQILPPNSNTQCFRPKFVSETFVKNTSIFWKQTEIIQTCFRECGGKLWIFESVNSSPPARSVSGPTNIFRKKTGKKYFTNKSKYSISDTIRNHLNMIQRLWGFRLLSKLCQSAIQKCFGNYLFPRRKELRLHANSFWPSSCSSLVTCKYINTYAHVMHITPY